jgi:ABC-type uncharacterized transport system substrate-binding protein
MRRRAFIVGLGGAAAWPLVARAQQVRKVYQIGVLLPGTPATFARRTSAFLEGMRTLGYVEGQTINVEWRWGQDKVEGLPELAADLVGRKPDVLVTAGTSAAKALKNATGTIPIVMAIIGPGRGWPCRQSCSTGWECHWPQHHRPGVEWEATRIA